jgi:hypothetical protein
LKHFVGQTFFPAGRTAVERFFTPQEIGESLELLHTLAQQLNREARLW